VTSELVQFLLSGIAAGGIYALIAVGFVTVYNVLGIINFAQGEFAMFGALVAASLVTRGVPLLAAVPLAVLATAAIGAAVERVVLAPAAHSSEVVRIIITIGLSIGLRGVALVIWSSQSYVLPQFSTGPPLTILGAALARQNFWVLAVAAAVMLGLYLLFERTYFGSALRATVMNRDASRLMGISPATMSLVAYSLSAALGAVAGIVVAPIALATYDMGIMLGLKGFVAAVLGGLVSAPGAVVGGLVLGVVESFAAGLLSSGYRDAIAFALLLAVLAARPTGLFSRTGGERRV
jgi:branched-chain amino acid transport system permease protein